MLRAGGSIATDGARLTAGGAITVSNVSPSAASRSRGAMAASADAICTHNNIYLSNDRIFAPPEAIGTGTDGKAGDPITVECSGEMEFAGGLIAAAEGQEGGHASVTGGGTARAGHGGNGGMATIRAPRITIRRASTGLKDGDAPPLRLSVALEAC